MDYDPTTQQYRERNNASWDRIRHENASSVRSEPADPSYFFNNYDYNFDPFPELIPQQEVNDYVPQDHLLNLDYVPIIDNQSHQPLLDHNNLQNIQQPLVDLDPIPIPYAPMDIAPMEMEMEDELDDGVNDTESSDESSDEVDRPDVYCMDCYSKVEDTDSHDIATCSKSKSTKFGCNMCEKEYNFEKNLKVHKILKHSNPKTFVSKTLCPFCVKEPSTFSRYTAFIGHIKIHIKPDSLKCEVCGTEFQNEKELKCHVRRDHSDEAYELAFCPKCKKIITLEESAAHCLLHIAEKQVEKKKSERKKEPPKTLLSKLQPKKPPETTKSKQSKTAKRQKKHQCSDCEKSFVRPSELARHVVIHLRKLNNKLNDPDVVIPKWKCQICDKEYCHQSGLFEHRRTVHGTGNGRQFVCKICGMSFTKRSNYTRHTKRIHPLDQDSKVRTQYQCPDCPTVFNVIASLTRHKREYHLNAPHMKQTRVIPIYERHLCPVCKREFQNKTMLMKHERLHLISEHRWRYVQGGGERKCDFCDKSFVLRASLIWHVQKHYEEQQQEQEAMKEQPYCALCELHFYSIQELRQHQDEQHSVTCGSCHQKFSSRQQYEDHICNRRLANRGLNNQLLPNNRVVICRQCHPPQRLTTARQIKEHRAKHLPRKTHLCWTCHKSFRTAQLLSLHAEVHDRQPVQCSYCPQVFHSRVALKQHIRITHGGDTNYQCVVHVDRTMAMSAQSFAEYGLVADHNDEQAHRAHSVTDWMDTEEEQMEQMEQDLRYQPMMMNQNMMGMSQSNHVTRQMNGASDAPIRCEVCHHLYENIEMLCDHWQTSDTDTDHSYQIVTCPICETRIRGASEAANHLRNAHLFARPKLFQFVKPAAPEIIVAMSTPDDSMALVPSTAIIPSSVIIHPSTQKKAHQCGECSKIFTRKNDLDRHKKIHTGEKSFLCTECGRAFRMKSTLTNHMATHTENPPQFQCTVCQKSMYDKKSLVVHMRIHTGEQPHKCRFCDLHFRTIAMQRTHEKKCLTGGPHRPILPDPTTVTSSFQPQYVAPEVDMNRTITQISSLPDQPLQLSRNSAFNTVQSMGEMATSGDMSIFVITKPITSSQYVVIVQKMRPLDITLRSAVDTVSEIKIHQLQESTNLSIVLHNEMRLNLNTVKMFQMILQLRMDDVYKTRVNVGDDLSLMHPDSDLFTIIAHNKTSGVSSFITRCEICEVDLPTKRVSDAHFYSEDHETAQLMYPSRNPPQPVMSVDRNLGMPNNMMSMNHVTSNEFNCKLCGSRFMDMNSLLNHIRREHDDEPNIPPRPVAHTAPIN